MLLPKWEEDSLLQCLSKKSLRIAGSGDQMETANEFF